MSSLAPKQSPKTIAEKRANLFALWRNGDWGTSFPHRNLTARSSPATDTYNPEQVKLTADQLEVRAIIERFSNPGPDILITL
jgi:hypothetical protein